MIFQWLVLLISVSSAFSETSTLTGIWTKDGCVVPVSSTGRTGRLLKGLLADTSAVASSRSVTGFVVNQNTPITPNGGIRYGCETPCGCYTGKVEDPSLFVVARPEVLIAEDPVRPLVPSPPISPIPDVLIHEGTRPVAVSAHGEMGLPLPVTGEEPFLQGGESAHFEATESGKTHTASEHDSESIRENQAAVDYQGPRPGYLGNEALNAQVSSSSSSKTHDKTEADTEFANSQSGGYSNNYEGGRPYPPGYQGNTYYGGVLVNPDQYAAQHQLRPSGASAYYEDSQYGKTHNAAESDTEFNQQSHSAINGQGSHLRPVYANGGLNAEVSSSSSSKTHDKNVADSEFGSSQKGGYDKYQTGLLVPRPIGGESAYYDNSQYGKTHTASEHDAEIKKENQGSLNIQGPYYGQRPYVTGGLNAEVSSSSSSKTHDKNVADTEFGSSQQGGYNKYDGGHGYVRPQPVSAESAYYDQSQYGKTHTASEHDAEIKKENQGSLNIQGPYYAQRPYVTGGLNAEVSSSSSSKTHDKNVADTEFGSSQKGGYNKYQDGLGPRPIRGESAYYDDSNYGKTHTASEHDAELNKQNHAGVHILGAHSRPVYGNADLYAQGSSSSSSKTHDKNVADTEFGSSQKGGYNKHEGGVVGLRPVGVESGYYDESKYGKTHTSSEHDAEIKKENQGSLNIQGPYYGRPYVSGGLNAEVSSSSSSKTHDKNVADTEFGSSQKGGYDKYHTGLLVPRPIGGESAYYDNSQYGKTHTASEHDAEIKKENQGSLNIQGGSSLPVYRPSGVSIEGSSSSSSKTHDKNVADSEFGSSQKGGYNKYEGGLGYVRPQPVSAESGYYDESKYGKTHTASEHDAEVNQNSQGSFAITQPLRPAPGLPVDYIPVTNGASGYNEAFESSKTHSASSSDAEFNKNSHLGYNVQGNVPRPYTTAEGIYIKDASSSKTHDKNVADTEFASSQKGGVNKYQTGLLVPRPIGGESAYYDNSQYGKTHSASEHDAETKQEIQGSLNSKGPYYVQRPYVGGGLNAEVSSSSSSKTHDKNVADSEFGSSQKGGYDKYQTGLLVPRPIGGESGYYDNSQYGKTHTASEHDAETKQEIQGSLNSKGPYYVQRPYVGGGLNAEVSSSSSSKTHDKNVADSEFASSQKGGYNKHEGGVVGLRPVAGESAYYDESKYGKTHTSSEHDAEIKKENQGSLNIQGVSSLPVYAPSGVSAQVSSSSSSKTQDKNVADSEFGSSQKGGYNKHEGGIVGLRPVAGESAYYDESKYGKTHTSSEHDAEIKKENQGSLNIQGGSSLPVYRPSGVSIEGSSSSSSKTHDKNVADSEFGSSQKGGVNKYQTGLLVPRPIGGESAYYDNSQYGKTHTASEHDAEIKKENQGSLNIQGGSSLPVYRPSGVSIEGSSSSSSKTHDKNVADSEFGSSQKGGYDKYQTGLLVPRPIGGESAYYDNSQYGKTHTASEHDAEVLKQSHGGVHILGSHPVYGNDALIAQESSISSSKTHDKNVADTAFANSQKGGYNNYQGVGVVPVSTGSGYYDSSSSGKTHSLSEHDAAYNKQEQIGVSSGGVVPIGVVQPVYQGSNLYVSGQESSKEHSKTEKDTEFSNSQSGGYNYNRPVAYLGGVSGGVESSQTGNSHLSSLSNSQTDNSYATGVYTGAQQGYLVPSTLDCQRCAEYQHSRGQNLAVMKVY